jgi:superfamily I DNA/RNA helicase
MSNIDKILRELNPEQRKAVETIDGPALVLAGAGTGKTRVITYRIAYMLAKGIPPENILGLTFTNKAAKEMKERLAALVSPEKAQTVMLGTFHSFCVRILRREIRALNYLPNFTIADEGDQAGIIKQAAAVLGYAKSEAPVPEISAYISSQKNRLIDCRTAKNSADNDLQAKMAHVYDEYQQILCNQNMLDFDDMLFLVYRIFKGHPDILEKYQEIYQYILVDEYQDTNDAQFTLIKQLCGRRCNLCVVGDDDQSIYGWRGANISNILDFPNMFKGTKQIKLEQNYRSTNKILNAANIVIAGNASRHPKKLWSNNGEGENIRLVEAMDGETEADFIADFIVQEIAENSDLGYSDFAVLYRSSHLSRLLEQSLRKAGVPYRLVGGQEFFKRKEIKDAVAYLKLLVNPREDQSLLRILNIPPRGLGDKAVDRLKALKNTVFLPMTGIIGNEDYLEGLASKAASSARELDFCLKKYRQEFAGPGNLAAKVQEFLTACGYLDGLQKVYKDIEDSVKRQENVYEFISAVAMFEKKADEPATLENYLESYALLEENDKVEDRSSDGNSVTLTTVHAAKGLEFPYVFVIAMERNIFPHERSEAEGKIDEERRLFYVALTRARRNLLITHAGYRMHRGMNLSQAPSKFLQRLPDEIVDRRHPEELIKTMSKNEVISSVESMFERFKD